MIQARRLVVRLRVRRLYGVLLDTPPTPRHPQMPATTASHSAESLIAGLLGCSLAATLGGLAQPLRMLVAARAPQRMFGALLTPSARSLRTVTFADSPALRLAQLTGSRFRRATPAISNENPERTTP